MDIDRAHPCPRASAFAVLLSAAASLAAGGEPASTALGIQGDRFTLDGKPTFLLGISYYGALGAPEESIRRDLDDMKRLGFNWLRVWATWDSFGTDVSAVEAGGRAREPFLGKLVRLVAECDRRGIAVDVTFTRSRDRLADLDAHRRAVETVVGALREHRNWYLDLANERDVRDGRYVSAGDLKVLRDLARRSDPRLLVTASFGGHDLDPKDIREALVEVGLDFLCPHRPRDEGSPARTESKVRSCLAMMAEIGREAPVHFQEPFRRGYGAWEPKAADFLTDLRGAVTGGAAGWCFHNGSQRGTPESRPRRSFDLRDRRLFDDLDDEERIVVAGASKAVQGSRNGHRP